MRALRVLLVGFGFLFGLLIAAVGLLIDWAIGPYRTNFAYVDGDTYGTLVAIAINQPSLSYPIALPLVGALLGGWPRSPRPVAAGDSRGTKRKYLEDHF